MARSRTPAAGLVLAAALALSGCVPSSEAPPPAPGLPGYIRAVPAAEVDLWRGVNDRGLTLDVREMAEWDDALGHLDGAMHIPYGEVEARLPDIAAWRDRPVLIYDRDGRRAQATAQMIARNGFRDVSWMDGGLVAYRDWLERR